MFGQSLALAGAEGWLHFLSSLTAPPSLFQHIDTRAFLPCSTRLSILRELFLTFSQICFLVESSFLKDLLGAPLLLPWKKGSLGNGGQRSGYPSWVGSTGSKFKASRDCLHWEVWHNRRHRILLPIVIVWLVPTRKEVCGWMSWVAAGPSSRRWFQLRPCSDKLLFSISKNRWLSAILKINQDESFPPNNWASTA